MLGCVGSWPVFSGIPFSQRFFFFHVSGGLFSFVYGNAVSGITFRFPATCVDFLFSLESAFPPMTLFFAAILRLSPACLRSCRPRFSTFFAFSVPFRSLFLVLHPFCACARSCGEGFLTLKVQPGSVSPPHREAPTKCDPDQ